MMFARWGGFPVNTGVAFLLLLLAGLSALILLGVIVWAASRTGGRRADQGQPPAGDRSLEILRERYARGEITREEFEAMRRDLGA